MNRKNPQLVRSKKHTLAFNTFEYNALEKFCKKYRVRNKSKFMRETIMFAVLSKFSEDYPTLWEQPK